MKITKRQEKDCAAAALQIRAAAALADGVDPLEVYKHAGNLAFDVSTEHIAEIYRRHRVAAIFEIAIVELLAERPLRGRDLVCSTIKIAVAMVEQKLGSEHLPASTDPFDRQNLKLVLDLVGRPRP